MVLAVAEQGAAPTTRRTAQVGDADAASRTDHRVEALVGGLPVEVVALLGTAELTLSQLAGLKAGDVVLLKQRVSEPLSAVVAGRPRFRVWPGRSGSRQACRIDSLTES